MTHRQLCALLFASCVAAICMGSCVCADLQPLSCRELTLSWARSTCGHGDHTLEVTDGVAVCRCPK